MYIFICLYVYIYTCIDISINKNSQNSYKRFKSDISKLFKNDQYHSFALPLDIPQQVNLNHNAHARTTLMQVNTSRNLYISL